MPFWGIFKHHRSRCTLAIKEISREPLDSVVHQAASGSFRKTVVRIRPAWMENF
jgi:hypothetical protein